MNKSSLSETDIRTKYITPAIAKAGWDIHSQMREEFTLAPGRIMVRGKQARRDTASARRADYVLSYKPNLHVAVVEAKDNKHGVGDGMQQALAYAELLDVPFAFSSNGDGFVMHDRTGQGAQVETHLGMDEFPSPESLWQRYCQWKGLDGAAASVAAQDYYTGKAPRYYQSLAINRTVEAIARGQDRILLVMATGTGKTYTAFQIIWRLWKSGAKQRILFLADRNILVDQTMVNDFRPFKGAMAKLSPKQKGVEVVDGNGDVSLQDMPLAISRKTKKVDTSYEIYLSLYQAVTGKEGEEDLFRQFSPDFFDLVIIDECHRGSAAEDSAWRAILDYFGAATHIGLTATPKETEEVSNISYFGEPVYSYTLKQGIDDGYLAPYKVVRVTLDKDLGWRPTRGKLDANGQLIEDREYNASDINRSLVLTQRDITVAHRISEYLQATDPMAKTIVFCEDVDHAERMRQALTNANPEQAAKNHRYVMRITGDNSDGKLELDNFIDPEKPYPVIATTSRLMTTGVDAKTCKLVVLDRTINSMTEFKQIIGRGTRIDEEHGKLWFTILDFKGATRLFADPAFDGEPVVIYDPQPNDPIVPPVEADGAEPPDGFPDGADVDPQDPDQPVNRRLRYVVHDVPVHVANERVQYYGPDGALVTESLKDFTRIQIGKRFASLDDFLNQWNSADKKQAIIDELEQQGIFFDALAEEVGQGLDPFDLICHIAYNQKPLTRRERASRAQKDDLFGKYGDTARKVIQLLLDKYADGGVGQIESIEVLKLKPFDELGSPIDIVRAFGGKPAYLAAIRQIEQTLYRLDAR